MLAELIVCIVMIPVHTHTHMVPVDSKQCQVLRPSTENNVQLESNNACMQQG